MKCECCKERDATVKDFRTDPETDVTGSYRVCRECFNLSDLYFFRQLRGFF